MSDAEALLTLAREFLYFRSALIIPQSGNRLANLTESDYARIALALKFAKLPPAKRFIAVMEEWDIQRIVREVY